MRGPDKQTGDRPDRSSRASICGRCLVCTCEWSRGKPVPGWEAVPSTIYSDGYQVISCPQFRPMPGKGERI